MKGDSWNTSTPSFLATLGSQFDDAMKMYAVAFLSGMAHTRRRWQSVRSLEERVLRRMVSHRRSTSGLLRRSDFLPESEQMRTNIDVAAVTARNKQVVENEKGPPACR